MAKISIPRCQAGPRIELEIPPEQGTAPKESLLEALKKNHYSPLGMQIYLNGQLSP
jgi:hypothetical protein